MRSLMHQLAHRLEKLERVADDRVQQIEGRLDESLRDVKREIEEIHANMGSYDGLSILDPNHFFKVRALEKEQRAVWKTNVTLLW